MSILLILMVLAFLQDETTLVWFSHKKERNLKLDSITRIIPGQRTVSYTRYCRLENTHRGKTYFLLSNIYRLFSRDFCDLKKIIYLFLSSTIMVNVHWIWLVKH